MEENTQYTPPDYIVDTVTDAEGIRSTIRTMLPPVRYHLNLILALLMVLMAPSLFVLREYVLAVCMIVAAVCCFIMYLRLPRITAEHQIARIRESYGADAVPCQLVFWPQGVVINNRSSGGSTMMRYEIVRAINRCGDYLTFRTQENQSVILRLQDVADKPDFVPYFLKKCTHAKKKGF